MDYSDLTEAQKARVKECTTAEELIALAKSEGLELSDAELEAVAGGSWNSCHGLYNTHHNNAFK